MNQDKAIKLMIYLFNDNEVTLSFSQGFIFKQIMPKLFQLNIFQIYKYFLSMIFTSNQMYCILFLCHLLSMSNHIETKPSNPKITCSAQSNKQTQPYKCIMNTQDSSKPPLCNFSKFQINQYKMLFCLKNHGNKKDENLYIQLYELQGIDIYDLTIDAQSLEQIHGLSGWYTEPSEIFQQFKNNGNDRLKINQNGVIKLSIPYGNKKTKTFAFVTMKRSEGLPDVVKRQVSSLKKQNRLLTSALSDMSNSIKLLQEQIVKLKDNKKHEQNDQFLTKLQIVNFMWKIYDDDGFVQKIRLLENGNIQSLIRRPQFAFWKYETQGFITIYNVYRQITCKLTHNFRDFKGKWHLRGVNRQKSSAFSSQSFFLVQKNIINQDK